MFPIHINFCYITERKYRKKRKKKQKKIKKMDAYFKIRSKLVDISSYIKTTKFLLQREIKEVNDMVRKFEQENVTVYKKLLDKINTLEKK